MSTRRLLLTGIPLLLGAALSVSGCRSSGEPEPLDPAALAAVAERPGVNRERLARAVDALFEGEASGETRALVVMANGRIVAERYGQGYDRGTRLIGWSMSKSITGVLIGLLVSDGRLRLDESVPIAAWQRPGDPRGEITLRQLLQMRSGLRHVESGSPAYASDEVRMLFLDGRDDMAAYAEEQPLEAEPGARFRYSTASTVILADIAARVLTDSRDPAVRRQVVGDYLQARLLQPAGLRSMVPEFDAAGTLIGSSMIHATARDWARFGEFLRNGGAVAGTQVVPRGWITFMTTPSPANRGYGGQLWLNRPQPDGHLALMRGDAPPGLFAAVGHLGQYVMVSPRQGLTVVRLGHSDPAQRKVLLGQLAAIIRLFPRR